MVFTNALSNPQTLHYAVASYCVWQSHSISPCINTIALQSLEFKMLFFVEIVSQKCYSLTQQLLQESKANCSGISTYQTQPQKKRELHWFSQMWGNTVYCILSRPLCFMYRNTQHTLMDHKTPHTNVTWSTCVRLSVNTFNNLSKCKRSFSKAYQNYCTVWTWSLTYSMYM